MSGYIDGDKKPTISANVKRDKVQDLLKRFADLSDKEQSRFLYQLQNRVAEMRKR